MKELFVGTYTKENALLNFSFSSGDLMYIKSYQKIKFCSYLNFKENTLYALSESDKWSNGHLFILRNNNIHKVSSHGINPCYVNVGKYIYICNYSSENICIYDNSNLICNYKIEKSLPHSISEYKNNLIIVDKNNHLFSIDSHMNISNIYSFKECVEPRHIVIFDDIFYIISESSNELFIFKDYKLVNKIKVSEGNGCAIKIYKNFLFTTARESNLINVFDISDRINPILTQSISSHGKNPRDMDFSDNYLLVCNVDSNNISVFYFDGHLKYRSNYHIEKPYCICFKK